MTEKLRRFASLRCIDTDQHQIVLKAFRIIIIYHLLTVYIFFKIIACVCFCTSLLLSMIFFLGGWIWGAIYPIDSCQGIGFPEVKAKCCPKELNFWNLPPSSSWGQGFAKFAATLGKPPVLVGSDGWEHPSSFRNCFEYDLMFAYVWKQPLIWNYAWNVLIPSQT